MVMSATVLLKAIRQCKPGWAELGAWTDEFALDSVACCARSVKCAFTRSTSQGVAGLCKELIIEPMGQAADFDARAWLARHQSKLGELLAMGLAKVFGDDRRAGNWRCPLLNQNRRVAGRVELEELGAPLPGTFLDQTRHKTDFFKHQPHET